MSYDSKRYNFMTTSVKRNKAQITTIIDFFSSKRGRQIILLFFFRFYLLSQSKSFANPFSIFTKRLSALSKRFFASHWGSLDVLLKEKAHNDKAERINNFCPKKTTKNLLHGVRVKNKRMNDNIESIRNT